MKLKSTDGMHLGPAQIVREIGARVLERAGSPVWFFNEWFNCGPMQVYIRFGQKNIEGTIYVTIDVSNINISVGYQDQGRGSAFFDALQLYATAKGYTIYVENILNDKLVSIVKRRGYSKHNTGWANAVCYYLLPEAQ